MLYLCLLDLGWHVYNNFTTISYTVLFARQLFMCYNRLQEQKIINSKLTATNEDTEKL